MELETINESLLIALEESWENFRKKKESGEKPRRRFTRIDSDEKKEELKKAKEFKSNFGADNFVLKYKGKDWYIKFTTHAMSRYIERDAKLDRKYLDDLITKMIKVLQFKEKNKMFLVYSVSLKRAMVVNRKTDDSFVVVTVYPEGENVQSKNTQKVLIENLYYGLIEEYVEIE